VPLPDIVPPGGTYLAAPGAPAGTILYITPDGIEYPLVTPHVTGRFVMSMSGGGAAPIQYISQRGPNQDGETVRGFSLTPRVIQILERQQFKSRSTWWDGRADILNDLRPNRQATATVVVTGTFRVVTANGDVRDLNVFLQDGPRFEARNVDEWDEWAFEEVLRFIAHDPLWFDPARVDLVLAFTLDANLVFPITFPIQFGGGLIDVSTNLDYTGTWASLPTIVIVGPIDNPIIDNTTTGEKIELSSVIGPGRTVTIDLAFGQKTIVDDLGNNLLGSLTTDSDLGTFHIAPTPEAPQVVGQPRPTARNVIRLRGSNPTGATSVEVRYLTRYFGI
jgi:(2Fe-2S) ferredoxin